MLKKIITVFMFVSFATLFAGCEGTLKGMGDDIEKMGKAIKDTVSSDKSEDKDSKEAESK